MPRTLDRTTPTIQFRGLWKSGKRYEISYFPSSTVFMKCSFEFCSFQLFTPTETIENSTVLDLLFAQVVMDVFATSCLRIRKEDKVKMKSMLGGCQLLYCSMSVGDTLLPCFSFIEGYGISPRNVLSEHKQQTKQIIVDVARDWPFYFARLYPVNVSSCTSFYTNIPLTPRQLPEWVRYEKISDSLN